LRQREILTERLKLLLRSAGRSASIRRGPAEIMRIASLAIVANADTHCASAADHERARRKEGPGAFARNPQERNQ